MTATYDDLQLEDLVDASFVEPELTDESESERLVEGEPRDPDDKFIEIKKLTPRAKRYQDKVKRGLNFFIRGMVQSPAMVDDAAVLIYHGPGVAKAVGQLADADERARKIIDFISDDTIENPYILTVMAIAPMAFQLLRNHEESLAKGTNIARVRIPFTKRYIPLKLKLRFRFRGLENVSYPKPALSHLVFGNPAIREAFAKQDIKIAWPPIYESRNGRH